MSNDRRRPDVQEARISDEVERELLCLRAEIGLNQAAIFSALNQHDNVSRNLPSDLVAASHFGRCCLDGCLLERLCLTGAIPFQKASRNRPQKSCPHQHATPSECGSIGHTMYCSRTRSAQSPYIFFRRSQLQALKSAKDSLLLLLKGQRLNSAHPVPHDKAIRVRRSQTPDTQPSGGGGGGLLVVLVLVVLVLVLLLMCERL